MTCILVWTFLWKYNVKQNICFFEKEVITCFDKKIVANWKKRIDDAREESISGDPKEEPTTENSKKTHSLWIL